MLYLKSVPKLLILTTENSKTVTTTFGNLIVNFVLFSCFELCLVKRKINENSAWWLWLTLTACCLCKPGLGLQHFTTCGIVLLEMKGVSRCTSIGRYLSCIFQEKPAKAYPVWKVILWHNFHFVGSHSISYTTQTAASQRQNVRRAVGCKQVQKSTCIFIYKYVICK